MKRKRQEEGRRSTKKVFKYHLKLTYPPHELLYKILLISPKRYHKTLSKCGNKTLFLVWLSWAQTTEQNLIRQIGYQKSKLIRSPRISYQLDYDQNYYNLSFCDLSSVTVLFHDEYYLKRCNLCEIWPRWVGSNMGGSFTDICDDCIRSSNVSCTKCEHSAQGSEIYCKRCKKWFCEPCSEDWMCSLVQKEERRVSL